MLKASSVERLHFKTKKLIKLTLTNTNNHLVTVLIGFVRRVRNNNNKRINFKV